MRVLVFHGYMLRGTGSNIYNVNLARALAQLGHEVHLLCQDREVRIEGVQIHNPDIGGLLPVYVKDPYEGFEVKAFPELTDAELERYIEANVTAVREVAAAVGGIDLALANHLVMGPAILARAAVAPFAVKIHGSALEYTVKPHPRFLPYAREGVEAANGVLTGSGHTAESLWTALADLPDLRDKTRLGPPGVDIGEFRPQGEREQLVAFVGKLIVSKGVDLLLAAWPLVRAANPEVRLEVAGFGAYEEGLRRLLVALEQGDLDEAREIARRGWALEGGEERPLPILSAFLADPPEGYAEMARAAAGSVELIGRLEHHQVASLFPRAEVMVMSSTFPEAFGMVAVEAAACGTLPVSAGHSGMLEVSRQLREALPEAVAPLVSFPVEEGAVEAIAARLNDWLRLPENQREAARQALVETVRRLWSWEGVARGVLAAAAGKLDDLPRPSA
ncbi:MAG TPA: glycosyltransferase family 4 protein [Solirubrobacterales bacterium]|jgi:glycosyltransferase involved in cell wall biosynthesis|nr:glycosyltransferase family 4 protein [Solirubrobacterales bacterium]